MYLIDIGQGAGTPGKAEELAVTLKNKAPELRLDIWTKEISQKEHILLYAKDHELS